MTKDETFWHNFRTARRSLSGTPQGERRAATETMRLGPVIGPITLAIRAAAALRAKEMGATVETSPTPR